MVATAFSRHGFEPAVVETSSQLPFPTAGAVRPAGVAKTVLKLVQLVTWLVALRPARDAKNLA